MLQPSSMLSSLPFLRSGRSCSINAENRNGEKGGACHADSPLGHSRKGSPCIDRIPSGATETLMDIDGCGVIQHIWVTVTDETEKGHFVLRDLVLRMYWDHEETPSVEVPLGDFFLNGFARSYEVCSIPMAVNPRRGMNCYLPMPFSSHARIAVENQHPGDICGFFFQIDFVRLDTPLSDAGTLHAQWRRQKLTRLQEDYVILDGVRGRGVRGGAVARRGGASARRPWRRPRRAQAKPKEVIRWVGTGEGHTRRPSGSTSMPTAFPARSADAAIRTWCGR